MKQVILAVVLAITLGAVFIATSVNFGPLTLLNVLEPTIRRQCSMS